MVKPKYVESAESPLTALERDELAAIKSARQRQGKAIHADRALQADIDRLIEIAEARVLEYNVLLTALSNALDDFRSLSKSAGTKAARMHGQEAYEKVRAALAAVVHNEPAR